VPIRTEWFDALLKQRCKLADVENFSAHDLRSAASTWARAAGVSPWFVKELLGHAEMNTTMIYAHESQDKSGAKVVLKKLCELRKKALQAKVS
jgi:integrase